MAEPRVEGNAHIGGEPLVRHRGVLVGLTLWRVLQEAEQTFGPIWITDGYRSNAQQATLKKKKPNLAAAAGKSFHERGLAIDVNLQKSGLTGARLNQFGSYMQDHGFAWGRYFKGKKEDWHFGFGEGGIKLSKPKASSYLSVDADTSQTGGTAAEERPTEEMVRTVWKTITGFDPTPEIIARYTGTVGDVAEAVAGTREADQLKAAQLTSGITGMLRGTGMRRPPS